MRPSLQERAGPVLQPAGAGIDRSKERAWTRPEEGGYRTTATVSSRAVKEALANSDTARPSRNCSVLSTRDRGLRPGE